MLQTHLLVYSKKPVSLFNQNSDCDQIFTFLLVASYFLQGAGSGSRTQPEDENCDAYRPIMVIQTLPSDWFGHCHVMPSGVARGKLC